MESTESLFLITKYDYSDANNKKFIYIYLIYSNLDTQWKLVTKLTYKRINDL